MLTLAVAEEMSTFLSTINVFFEQGVTWMGNLVNYIISQPALVVLCFAMPICGFAIGLLNRLIRLG